MDATPFAPNLEPVENVTRHIGHAKASLQLEGQAHRRFDMDDARVFAPHDIAGPLQLGRLDRERTQQPGQNVDMMDEDLED